MEYQHQWNSKHQRFPSENPLFKILLPEAPSNHVHLTTCHPRSNFLFAFVATQGARAQNQSIIFHRPTTFLKADWLSRLRRSRHRGVRETRSGHAFRSFSPRSTHLRITSVFSFSYRWFSLTFSHLCNIMVFSRRRTACSFQPFYSRPHHASLAQNMGLRRNGRLGGSGKIQNPN